MDPAQQSTNPSNQSTDQPPQDMAPPEQTILYYQALIHFGTGRGIDTRFAQTHIDTLERVTQMENQMREVQEKVKNLVDRVSEIENRVDNLDNEIVSLEGEVKVCATDDRSTVARQDKMESEVYWLRAECQGNDGNIGELEVNVENLDARVSKLEQEREESTG